jgi:hypothetical protein
VSHRAEEDVVERLDPFLDEVASSLDAGSVDESHAIATPPYWFGRISKATTITVGETDIQTHDGVPLHGTFLDTAAIAPR